jgi:hypothetical protein
MTGPVGDAAASAGVEDEFALFGFPEFVRLGDGFCGDAPLELEVGELTDPVLPLAGAAPRRAASWSPVTHTAVPSDLEDGRRHSQAGAGVHS